MPVVESGTDASIDITNDVCPMTFVRVKLALERLSSGAILRVRLNDGEPLRNVPRSAQAEGHAILELGPEAEGSRVHRLVLRRA
jgi:TusA-related sulfurtransferase